MIDFLFGGLSYDTHKGIDFGLPSLVAMEDRVEILAAADGIVRDTRNDMYDVIYTDDLRGEINGRDCGNGVVITYGDGWETQYCHLNEGAVAVQSGDNVTAGAPLGLVAHLLPNCLRMRQSCCGDLPLAPVPVTSLLFYFRGRTGGCLKPVM